MITGSNWNSCRVSLLPNELTCPSEIVSAYDTFWHFATNLLFFQGKCFICFVICTKWKQCPLKGSDPLIPQMRPSFMECVLYIVWSWQFVLQSTQQGQMRDTRILQEICHFKLQIRHLTVDHLNMTKEIWYVLCTMVLLCYTQEPTGVWPKRTPATGSN